uniref:Pleckstrin homology domain containing, family M (With RUN domain) member 1 n=2 Tax=Nothobranchius rachovii TaxID=451742 RepID=A0A1A8S7N3_9TELE
MLATQMPETPLEAKDTKQIKERLAQSLKALQKRYITSDAVVTSDDGDANLLCCALEAIFIHGIKSKCIRSEAGGRSRKGDRGPLPQPFFWSLLKTVTHRDVITELEKISFLCTDVGRCRAWLRLALNHGLLECYLASLFREDSKLRAHYQPSALLLNEEEREVLLSYVQGLASLTFNLSYKSAVLNEWTTTPLALAGLCPLSQLEVLAPSVNGGDHTNFKPTRKESWDTASQSSGSSEAVDVQKVCPVVPSKTTAESQEERTGLHSSNLSLDTTGSSHLSSSLSSDSLLQGQDPRSPTGDQWSSGDLDESISISTRRLQKDLLVDFCESGQCSQDSLREDSFVSSTGADPFSEVANFSSPYSEIQSHQMPSQDLVERLPNSDSEPPPSFIQLPTAEEQTEIRGVTSDLPSETEVVPSVSKPLQPTGVQQVAGVQETAEPVQETKQADNSKKPNTEFLSRRASQRSATIASRKFSLDSLSHSHSWISDDDIYKPDLEQVSDGDEVSPVPIAEPSHCQSPPSVVHRRQIGLSNPFRGLLKLGHLERRSAMAIWRDYYCELSPFEFRLYLNAEERTCCDNCSLLRCEDVRISSEGRFELIFSGKRLYLRAANRDEAEDWVDRIVEAVNKCRPAAAHADEQWEVLQSLRENGVDERALSSPSSASSSPERHFSSSDTNGRQQAASPQEFIWTRTTELETDALKEAVLYFSTDSEARTWKPLVFSLSLEALKSFRVQEGKKLLWLTHPIEEIRDVVPDVSQGGAAFFKVLTVKESLRLRAENSEEARSWRDLIRGALDSYLESGEDGHPEEPAPVWSTGVTGNLHRLVQHRLKEDGAFLVHLYTVPSEKGLDTQNFKCAGCPQQIGPSLGKARLCEFSGQYYCDNCHKGDTTIIPSRMLHNWDLTHREVSKRALRLLAQVEQEPLLNLEQLNPELVTHSESMTQAHTLREKLRLLGDYLLSCRSGACKKLQARMGQRTYLLESSHLYSVMDLRQIAESQYAIFLVPLVQHASNHVLNCDLCTQRGYICQICHSEDIIFPFQFESIIRCTACKAVFHRSCKSTTDSCPRCQRMKKYLERNLQE